MGVEQSRADFRGLGAFRGGHIDVAGGQGQAVGLAHRRTGLNARGHVEVADHAADDGLLLPVLLAEYGDIGPGEHKKFEHHGADPPEMDGPALAAEAFRQFRHLHPGGVVRRVHGTRLGHEEHVRAVAFGNGGVALGVAGVGFQILAGAELRGIHEQADHQTLGQSARVDHQVFMPGVVIAHGGNQGDILALGVPGPALGRQFLGIG